MVFAVADIVLLWAIWLWPIWFVADMVAPLLSHFFRHFNVNLKTDNYMSKTEYLIWQCDTSLHLVTSLLF